MLGDQMIDRQDLTRQSRNQSGGARDKREEAAACVFRVMKTKTLPAHSQPHPFLSKFTGQISGMLEGFDRLWLRGTLRELYCPHVMESYLNAQRILLKDFGELVERTTRSVRAAATAFAESWNRPVQYLASPQRSKEGVARELAQRDGITEGLIVVLSAVEPCQAFSLKKDAQSGHLGLELRARKCLHYYFYFEHEEFGFMHVRLQSWFPFQVDFCLNGRHWLARQLQKEGIAFVQRENAVVWVENLARAQELLAAQVKLRWEQPLAALVRQIHPCATEICRPLQLQYFWSVTQSEYASDVLFHQPEPLAQIYPKLVHHALRSFGSGDVMRFLGRQVPAHGQVSGHFEGEVISDLKRRPEGIRVKHSVNGNTVKLYDKQGTVLRVETTIVRPREFRVWRSSEASPQGPKGWRILRRSVADMVRRAEVSRKSNHRYLTALAATHATVPLADWAREVCAPVRRRGRRHRALNPLAPSDAALLEAVNQGEFVINGFRNAHIRARLCSATAMSSKAERALAAKIRRQIQLLRMHGLVQKVHRTHRYMVTEKGRAVITALLSARQADTSQLTKIAA